MRSNAQCLLLPLCSILFGLAFHAHGEGSLEEHLPRKVAVMTVASKAFTSDTAATIRNVHQWIANALAELRDGAGTATLRDPSGRTELYEDTHRVGSLTKGIDVVVLPELFAYNPYATLEASAETVPQPHASHAGASGNEEEVGPEEFAREKGGKLAVLPHCRSWAREFECYIVCTLVERVYLLGSGDDDTAEDHEREFRMYNSAVLVDRLGSVVGVYRKTFPTFGSYEEAGITPAMHAQPPVFETDFGRVGVLLCFDINFSELWAHLDSPQAAADIVLYPSAMAGTRLLSAYATIHNYYIVENGDRGLFFDIDGSQFQPSYESADGVVRVASLDLDRQLVHTTDPYNGGTNHIHNMLNDPDVNGLLVIERKLGDVDMWLVGSLHREVSVRREMQALALQDVRSYRRRARELIGNLRRHQRPCPGLGMDLENAYDYDLIVSARQAPALPGAADRRDEDVGVAGMADRAPKGGGGECGVK